MKTEIFKVQRPLAGEPLMLFYNQDRSTEFQFPSNQCPNLLKLMRYKSKIYVEASFVDGFFEVYGFVEDQEW